MASLRDAARSVLDDAKDAIGYLVIWKEKRSWNARCYYGIEWYEIYEPKIDEEIRGELEEILATDPDAICVNPYYDNLGELENMTLASLMDGIRFQREVAPGSLRMVLEATEATANEVEAEYNIAGSDPVGQGFVIRKAFASLAALKNYLRKLEREGDDVLSVHDLTRRVPVPL